MTNPYAGLSDKKFKKTARAMSKKRSPREKARLQEKELTRHARKNRRSLGARFHDLTDIPESGGGYDPHAGRKALVFLFIVLAVGGFVIYQGPAFHSYVPSGYKLKDGNMVPGSDFAIAGASYNNLWNDQMLSLSATDTMNTRLVNYCATSCVGTGFAAFSLNSNSTFSAIGIEKQTLDGLDQAVKHELLFESNYFFGSSVPNADANWGVFLTTNNTIPAENIAWNPYTDSRGQVLLFVQIHNTGAGGITGEMWIQKQPGESLQSEDTQGQNQSPASSTFIFGTGTQYTGSGTLNNAFSWILNYTGVTQNSNTKSGFSALTVGTGADITTSQYPPFNMQAQNHLYVGFWQSPCSTCVSVAFSLNTLVIAGVTFYFPGIAKADPPIAVISPTPPTAPDTGGFFGPVIRALISIGVYVLNAIAGFFGFIFTAFKQAMNAVGTFLGVGNIGTQITNAIAIFVTWIINVFSVAFSQITNAVTFLVNSLTTITNFVGTLWTDLNSFIAEVQSLLSNFWTVVSFFFSLSTITGKWIVSFWFVMGMFTALMGIDTWLNVWVRITRMFMLTAFKLVFWLYDQVLSGVIIRFKDVIFRWI